jgi:hypothetical protein
MMFSRLLQMLRKQSSSGVQIPNKARSRLCLEPLEERALLSGSPVLSAATGSSGGPPAPLVGIVDTSGTGPSGGSSGGSSTSTISGPGYPIAPTSGPTRPDSVCQTTQGQSTTFIPVTGTSGGNGTALTSVPVCVGSPGGPPSI